MGTERTKVYESINGNEFLFRNSESYEISVLQAGYIIDLDGNFIPVNDQDQHSDIFSQYLSKYLEENIMYNSISDAYKHLAFIGHIVYLGIKVANFTAKSNDDVSGVLLLPSAIDKLTDSQKKSCLELLSTNKSLFGNRERISMQYQKMRDFDFETDELSLAEVLQILNSSKQL